MIGIKEKLIRIITENSNSNLLAEEINLDTKFSSMGINSINFVKIIVTIEMEFDIEFNDDEIDIEKEYFSSVNSLICLIDEKIKTK